MRFYEDIQVALDGLRAAGRYRRLRRVETGAASAASTASTDGATAGRGGRPAVFPEVLIDGHAVLNFSSNNYLGLADDPRLCAGAHEASLRHGTGAGASRLIGGNLSPHEALEAALARHFCAEAALLFPSGYQAHVGVLPALVGEGDVVLSDALNHASIIDGCRLSRARVLVYRHGDVAHLDALLAEAAPRHRRVLVVSDTVFSMDGTCADVAALGAVCQRHEAALYLDEAHAVGVLGPGGRGLGLSAATLASVGPLAPLADPPLAPLGTLAPLADLRLGTLGKAFGGAGAFVLGPTLLIDYLRNTCRSFIFSTAPAVPVCGAALAALAIVGSAEGTARRQTLRQRGAELRAGLLAMGIPGVDLAGTTPIQPLRVRGGDDALAMRLSDALLPAGVFLQGIRPPTVPPGTARLRLTLSAAHTAAHVAHLLDVLRGVRDQLA